VIDIVAWAIAGALAIIVAGFGAFEIRWKLRRLRADLDQLDTVVGQLRAVQGDLTALAGRLSSTVRSVRPARRA
jgi:hypothetical protein